MISLRVSRAGAAVRVQVGDTPEAMQDGNAVLAGLESRGLAYANLLVAGQWVIEVPWGPPARAALLEVLGS